MCFSIEIEIFASQSNFSPLTEKVHSKNYNLYNLHKESSPNFGTCQDVLEIGWGDSPGKSTITCKKKLEPKESPKSSLPPKRRNIRSNLKKVQNSCVDIAKYVAEVQELSKNVMKELNTNVINKEKNLFSVKNSEIINNNIEDDCSYKDKSNLDYQKKNTVAVIDDNSNSDLQFDNILQSFIKEEDEWLLQALPPQDCDKTPMKNFFKCKSETELTLNQQNVGEINKNSRQKVMNNNKQFNRTLSFEITKSQDSTLPCLNKNEKDGESLYMTKSSTTQYSKEEIEQKRLEALYRREKKEIERKKMEALKRLEMKKLKHSST
ncbi:hypothetical protein Phum_PHUM420740 [Pediculus humanus corporis]|uniref:Uncharacterized protein n=1 Tax=Pediculus humanus subsp. corporis TaxID=121224 RepID=E0VSN0_PEDHC|nr:uncharacterized protein Phum_PHUM420740 [Pediculus humanus corporis]EEB16386.1 hypothetical protein Phum_PHUM420740 [Pediculus humanus corporis]